MAEKWVTEKNNYHWGNADRIRSLLYANGLEGHDPVWLRDRQWR